MKTLSAKRKAAKYFDTITQGKNATKVGDVFRTEHGLYQKVSKKLKNSGYQKIR